MSLELLNTLGTLTTVAIVAATAIAALVQLRHLRAGNQINAMLTIGDQFDGQEFREALELVNRELDDALQNPVFRAYHVAFARNQVPPQIDDKLVRLRHSVLSVCNAYEELGILIKNGIIDKEIFLDRYCWLIVQRWRNLSDCVALTREAVNTDAIWENFEYLAVISEDFIVHHRSAYPKGVKRMELRNPWPIAAA